MATISETELQRRLRNLESGITGGSGTSITAQQVGDTWEYIDPVIYLAYANDIFNLSNDGVITNQSDAAGFQYSPFNSQGVLLNWRGYLFSTSIYASGDATDYIWERVVTTSETTSVSFTRYYTVSSDFQINIGTPSAPGDDITWIQVSAASLIPSEAFWIADQFYLNGVLSSWQIYPVATRNLSAGVISYKKSGYNKPELGDVAWTDDVLIAATSFTGEVFGSMNELGYGTTVIIEYDNGKLSGTYKKTGWSPAEQFIDGDLIVTDTIAGDKINANSISSTHIVAGAIVAESLAADSVTADSVATNTLTATHIDTSTLNVEEQNLSGLLTVTASTGAIGWGKTGPNDFTNTGFFIGNNAGYPMMNFGSPTRYFYYDGQNDILYFTGQTATGPAVVGAKTTYTTGTSVRHDIPVNVTSVSLKMAGGGGGGRGYDEAYRIQIYSDPDIYNVYCGASANGGDGGDTIIKHYNSSDVLQNTYTAAGGDGGNSVDNNNTSNATPAMANGDTYNNGGPTDPFTGTGGDGMDLSGWTTGYASSWPSNKYPQAATGVGAGGGGGGCVEIQNGGSLRYNFAEGGDDGVYVATSSVTTTTGDYLTVTVGSGGAGTGVGSGVISWSGSSNSSRSSYGAADADGSGGAAVIEILTKS